jgi:hypothetical protein
MRNATRLVLSMCVPLTLGVLAACSQRDLGRYCFVGAEGGQNSNTSSITILNTEAPECGERLCLKQGGYKCVDGATNCSAAPDNQALPQSICTQECTANKDCEKTSENVNGCSKFVCQAQGLETGFGDHCICVCLDYLRDDDGNVLTVDEFNSDTEQACDL